MPIGGFLPMKHPVFLLQRENTFYIFLSYCFPKCIFYSLNNAFHRGFIFFFAGKHFPVKVKYLHLQNPDSDRERHFELHSMKGML